MRVFVIGASGFTGQRVLAACPDSWSLTGLARSADAEHIIRGTGASVARGDLDDPSSVEAALKEADPEVVVCVASLGFGHADGLVDAMEKSGGPRAVFTSTTGIFTKLEPESKQVRLDAEAAITASAVPATILRPTMIYGRPGDRNMERLLRWLRRVPVVVAPDGGTALQQPVHVDDLAGALVAAAVTDHWTGRAVNIAGPEAMPFAEIVHLAGEAVGRRARVVPVPSGALRTVVEVQERLLSRPRLKAEQIERLTEDKNFDPAPGQELLGHGLRPFADGISEEARLLGLTS